MACPLWSGCDGCGSEEAGDPENEHEVEEDKYEGVAPTYGKYRLHIICHHWQGHK